MTTRPQALRLAEAIDPLTRYTLDNLTCSAAAAELRRLQSTNAELLDALQCLMEWQVKNVHKWHNPAYDYAHEAIVRATGGAV